MKKNVFVVFVFWALLFCVVDVARATQVHAEPEGLWAHQIAHLFFIFSMGILIYWLRERNLIREAGWRLVQYSAFFFILWNIDAMIVHYLDSRPGIFAIVNRGTQHAEITFSNASKTLGYLYYVTKLDHLLCVPAIVFLYFGLRQLLEEAQKTKITVLK